MKLMTDRILDRELKKGSAELMILALVEARAAPRLRDQPDHRATLRRHRALQGGVALPLLYRLERRGWIAGQWVKKKVSAVAATTGSRARAAGVLAEQRKGWQRFVAAINRITEVGNA